MKKTLNTYQFTLILKNVDAHTPRLEDALYESGCDDALVNVRNGTVYLDFDRKAESLEKAVITAIRDIESASIGAVVANIAPETLVTESDVAKRLNMKRQIISLWVRGERRKKNPFPKPIMRLTDKSPLWKWSEITCWLYQNKLVKKKEIVDQAIFLEDISAVLEEREEKVRKTRLGLLKKIETITHKHL